MHRIAINLIALFVLFFSLPSFAGNYYINPIADYNNKTQAYTEYRLHGIVSSSAMDVCNKQIDKLNHNYFLPSSSDEFRPSDAGYKVSRVYLASTGVRQRIFKCEYTKTIYGLYRPTPDAELVTGKRVENYTVNIDEVLECRQHGTAFDPDSRMCIALVCPAPYSNQNTDGLECMTHCPDTKIFDTSTTPHQCKPVVCADDEELDTSTTPPTCKKKPKSCYRFTGYAYSRLFDTPQSVCSQSGLVNYGLVFVSVGQHPNVGTCNYKNGSIFSDVITICSEEDTPDVPYSPDNTDGTRGEKGERGEQGEKGERGDRGERGERGEQGEKGERGEQGPQGEKGERGERGLDGLDGLDGADGADGLDGADGADGRDGTNGADGRDGTNGADGRDGADGIDGKDGTNGADGAQGIQGIQGIQGLRGIAGIDGADGKDGKDGLSELPPYCDWASSACDFFDWVKNNYKDFGSNNDGDGDTNIDNSDDGDVNIGIDPDVDIDPSLIIPTLELDFEFDGKEGELQIPEFCAWAETLCEYIENENDNCPAGYTKFVSNSSSDTPQITTETNNGALCVLPENLPDEQTCNTSELNEKFCEFIEWSMLEMSVIPDDAGLITIHDKTQDVSIDKNLINLTQTCPADAGTISFTLMGHAYNGSFQSAPACDIATKSKYYIIFLGTLASFYTLAGTNKQVQGDD